MSLIDNRKAFFDYHIEERDEAGLVLEGWEVKAQRAGRGQNNEGYVVVKHAEIVLIGTH
ncbi:SsrA-binding protein, partial [Burkholderia pseudomallei]